MLEVKQLSKTYSSKNNKYLVLDDISFKVKKGEFVAVIGPSGSGKTTLLNCISGFIPADKGSILLGNKDLLKVNEEELADIRQKELGFVFQDFMLIDGLTVLENVYLPQIIAKKDNTEMLNHTSKLLENFGIEAIGEKYPNEISGGQKQRVAVARALSNNPLLLLADEPTGNLDSKSSALVIEAFISAKKNLNATIFMVTHDAFAASNADRIIALRDGKIVEELMRGNEDSSLFLDRILSFMKGINGAGYVSLNKLINKLIKKNLNQYLLLFICIILTVSIVSAIGLIYLSNTIKDVLIAGGSSSEIAKFCYIALFMACIVFISYVFTLFLKYKSKEIGIFMSLGFSKKNVYKIVGREMNILIPIAILVGLVLAYPVASLVWGIFNMFLSTNETVLKIGYMGYVIGTVYSMIIYITINIMLYRYLKKINIMDILKAEETIEEVKELKPWVTYVGIALIPLGIIGFDMLSRFDGFISLIGKLSFLLVPLGIYLICARLPYLGKTKKKKNPQKYYENMIFYNLLQLKGKQYVSAIFLTSIIIAISTFSFTFILAQVISNDKMIELMDADYTFKYRVDSLEINKDDIEKIAKENNTKINKLIDFESITMIIDSTNYDEKVGKEKYNLYSNDVEVISEDIYKKIFNKEIKVNKDNYAIVGANFGHRLIPEKVTLTNNGDKSFIKLTLGEKIENTLIDGLDSNLYVVNNEVYKEQKGKVGADSKLGNYIFYTDNWKDDYNFATALKNFIINNTNKSLIEHEFCSHRALEVSGGSCEYSNLHLTVDSENIELLRWWKYRPNFKILNKNNAVYEYAVYLLLFIFISTLGFLASGIILYVKSLSTMWKDKKIYKNISCLGMKERDIIKIIKRLQRILFIIPTLVGSLAALMILAVISLAQGVTFMIAMIVSSIMLIIFIYLIEGICYFLSTKKLLKELLEF